MLSCDVIIWDDNTPLFCFSWKLHSLISRPCLFTIFTVRIYIAAYHYKHHSERRKYLQELALSYEIISPPLPPTLEHTQIFLPSFPYISVHVKHFSDGHFLKEIRSGVSAYKLSRLFMIGLLLFKIIQTL